MVARVGRVWSLMSMDVSRAANPLFGPNRFKLGVFSANCDGGLTMSLAPERWPCEWDDIAAMSVLADEAGLEFILPVAKWRGYQGKANVYGRSFETLTHGAALAALTKRIAIFSTVHVPLVTPAFAAFFHGACAAGDAGLRGQGDRHDRPHLPRPRRVEHRVRLEPERIRPAWRHDRS
jgi:hypothetical protein